MVTSQTHTRTLAALFCGQSSYPRSDSATINRYKALAEMTQELGHDVIFINRHPAYTGKDTIPQNPSFEYHNASGPRRQYSWLRRQIARTLAPLREAILILQLGRSRQIGYIHVYSQFALDLIFYFLLSKILRARGIIHVVEYRSKFVERSKLFRLNDLIFEWLAPRLFQRFIAISSLIATAIRTENPLAKVAIVPPVCRFDRIAMIPAADRTDRYFLYCASMAYESVAWFVIEAFLQLRQDNINLVLVLSGNPSERIKAAARADARIEILSSLEFSSLIGLYRKAYALLIPLRECEQDAARFPQKITEYIASARPIISCKVGEVGKTFTHGKDAVVCENYDSVLYAAAMEYCLTHPRELELIAKAGYKTGMRIFDMQAQMKNIAGIL